MTERKFKTLRKRKPKGYVPYPQRMADILKVKVDDLIKEQEKPHFYKEDDDRQKSIKWRCSVCGSACYCYGGMYYKFCPNCGREMTGGVKK